MGQRVARRQPAQVDTVKVERVEAPQPPIRRAMVPVGSSHDPLEAQADVMAERALAISASYSDAAGSSFAEPTIATEGAPSTLRREASTAVDGLEVSQSTLDATSSGGRALDGGVRQKMEHGFGTDLGAIRVHTGAAAADLATSIHARAFTHGSDVYFGKGEYRPGTADGDRVLAHELAHTVQQTGDVHRYPATWQTSPVPWGPLTGPIFRPGEGNSGGVYILTGNDPGPVKKVVVKPVFGVNGLGMRESGQQLQFSDKALASLLGLSAPKSKVVLKGGSEFADLAALCSKKQPPPQPGEQAVPLTDAQSFVVMGEVPNAKTIGGLASAAGTDRRAGADLYRTVFDPTFLGELGRLCIGDLLLGNPDRLVFGAMNLGNVIVSMQKGKGSLAAIDTTAYLPKAVEPEDIVKDMLDFSKKDLMDRGPGELLDGFFRVMVDLVKAGTKDDATGGKAQQATPLWQIIENAYAGNRDKVLASFEFGWNDAMIQTITLSQQSKKIDDLTAGYDDPDVSASALKANISYIAERASGKGHDDSLGRSLALTAGGWADSIDRARMTPPHGDLLDARPITIPTGAAVKADIVSMPSLPSGKLVKRVTSPFPNPIANPKDRALFGTLPGQLSQAAQEVDQAISPTKKRGSMFGSTKDQPRNRSLAGHFVVDATATVAGTGRATDAATFVGSVASQVKRLSGADYKGNEAAPIASLVSFLATQTRALEPTLSAYKNALSGLAPAVAKTHHADKVELAAALVAADKYLDLGAKVLSDVKAMRLSQMAASLRAS